MNRTVRWGAPILAATLGTSLLSAASPTDSQASATVDRQALERKRKPCERKWPARDVRADDSRSGLGRPAPRVSQQNRESSAAPTSASSPGRRQAPNIVTIMTDDMRADELRGPWMRRTRQLIANQGANFVNSFAPQPLCGPARAAFLTGQYGHNNGVRDNDDPSSFKRFDDRRTLPQWLNNRRNGHKYNTAHIGKYLNGYGRARYAPPGWDEWYASLTPSTLRYFGTKLSDNGDGRINLSGKYQTTQYGKRSAQTIRRLSARSKPFFLNVAFSAPHTGRPREADDPKGLATPARLPRTRGKYDDRIVRPAGVRGEPCNANKPRSVRSHKRIGKRAQRKVIRLRRQRAESLRTVDLQVRRIIRSLRRSGELKNTYVIFTSDNGFFLGEFRHRLGKKLPYDPSLRTPTLIRGPGIAKGITRRASFSTIDFAPTIADMAGVRPRRKVDGVSRLPTAKGRDRRWRRAIRTDVGPMFSRKRYGVGIRTRGWFYGEYKEKRTPRELYKLGTDPHQNRNLAGKPKYRKTQRKLARKLDRLRSCSGRACRVRW